MSEEIALNLRPLHNTIAKHLRRRITYVEVEHLCKELKFLQHGNKHFIASEVVVAVLVGVVIRLVPPTLFRFALFGGLGLLLGRWFLLL